MQAQVYTSSATEPLNQTPEVTIGMENMPAPTAVPAMIDQGHGKVTFTGSIIDAPCSISPETVDQTVDMGQVSNVALKNGGKSAPRQFDIKLEQCDNSTLKTVTTTFEGKASAANKDRSGRYPDSW